jgi:hypothetical protein
MAIIIEKSQTGGRMVHGKRTNSTERKEEKKNKALK